MKRNYIRKIILASLAIIMTTGLLLSNGQKANASTINTNSSQVQVIETTLSKHSSYFNQNITLPNLQTESNDEKINIINEKINNSVNSLAYNMKIQSKEYFDMFEKEFTTYPYELNVNYKLTNKSTSLTSLYMDIYSFTGGAHGNTLRNAYTIDNNTKDLLSLNNLFIKGYDYKKIINDAISKQIISDPEKYFASSLNFEGVKDDVNFYVDGDNLIIYYQQYEIAPYCVGIPEFKIPLNLFGENYLYHNSITN
ncbi:MULTISPECIES: DUF3298 and DUF4163 domain-containing protein [Clostridium]|uniref:DUF3298/DUF4163 domain-containing protein n=1 Tax=Clostridium botulinum TaxID=1491 RepID=A0A6B4N9H7_CLOBO|nr:MULTISPECIES: DUF3298 and DUF4163 domain-containing protein [Clostridium]NFA42857.1 DUF3298/DUF4163 domain-containing protein [Clostridium botulinum]NFH81351.1 DUF3298 and DUF4163 domain-containing protein [Clostridium botulinum]NFH84865.1 DUF3298 and DUF4163 domain-containing protein [Clostridium botulinum]NFI12517.1 DUF3298 and DUF4163 domain-containing protein [Clostridium botulinum]NFI15400.1 DUF3298 and DUF4163 domain-containing protein [Clostridium botulinum]